MLFARVSSNSNGVGDILERERLELSVGRYNKKQNRRVVEETRPDNAIRSSVTITILPLGHDILKKKKKKNNNNKKDKCNFLKKKKNLDF